MPGIPRERFISPSFETFLCPICKDVVNDPVCVTCCEQSFCRSCIDLVPKCPQCNTNKKKQLKPMNRQLKEFYAKLRLRCLNPNCKEKLVVENFVAHDASCSGGNSCRRCVFEGNMTGHDCITWLMGERTRLLTQNEELTNKCTLLESKLANQPKATSVITLRDKGNPSTPAKSSSSVSPRKDAIFLSETKATGALKDLVTDAMRIADTKGLHGIKFSIDVQKSLHSEFGGIWHCVPSDNFDASKVKYVETTFCSMIFDGRDFFVYRDEKDEVETLDID